MMFIHARRIVQQLRPVEGYRDGRLGLLKNAYRLVIHQAAIRQHGDADALPKLALRLHLAKKPEREVSGLGIQKGLAAVKSRAGTLNSLAEPCKHLDRGLRGGDIHELRLQMPLIRSEEHTSELQSLR